MKGIQMPLKPKKSWLIYWIVAFGVLAFGVPEIIAIRSPEPGDTLSESLQYVFAGSPLGITAFLGFIAWFVWHILIQKKKPPGDE